MATKIIHKKSSVASSIPAAGDLEPGEIAVNLADQKLYSKTTGGTVIELAPDTVGGIAYTLHTANVTMAANEGVIADTSGGAFTVTLPASPTTGDTVVIADGADWATTNLVVGRNGSTIEGDAANMDMDIGGASVQFTYDGSTWQLYTTVGANNDQFATAAQGAKVDGIEASADVTDTANVTSAGALMDSELTSIASVKALNQGVATTDSPTYAGLTVDTDTLFVDATNNRLGIGTSSPSTDLDVAGGIRSTSSGGYNQITTTSIGDAVFNNNGNNWLTVKDGVPSDTLRINSSGNVGIGTTTPESLLHVAGDGTIARLEGSGGDYHGLGVQCSDASGSATKSIFIDTLNENSASVANMVGQVQSDGGSNWQWTTQPAGTRTDRRQERMRIDSSGNVGIGKNNPATPLDVTGTVTATAFAGDGSALTGVGGGIYESITSTDVTSSVATVEFDLDITTYKEFLFRIRDCIVETNNKYLYIQVSPDAGVTWRTTGYVGACRLLGINYTSTAGLFICVGIENGTNAFGSSIDTIIYNAGDSGKFTGSSSTGKVHHYNYGPQFQNSGAGYVTAETHNKMRVITNSGNITSGSFELMGELI
jgi:hypothetical protein